MPNPILFLRVPVFHRGMLFRCMSDSSGRSYIPAALANILLPMCSFYNLLPISSLSQFHSIISVMKLFRNHFQSFFILYFKICHLHIFLIIYIKQKEKTGHPALPTCV